LDIEHEWENNKVYSFKSLFDIVERIRKTCFNKETAEQDEVFGYQLSKILKELKFDTIESA
jgi:hypothetical protein